MSNGETYIMSEQQSNNNTPFQLNGSTH